jgi:hypothetical protein
LSRRRLTATIAGGARDRAAQGGSAVREIVFKIAFAVALSAGLWVVGVTAVRAWDGARLTAARRLDWRAADGTELAASDRPTCLGDPQLRTLLRDEELWGSCLPGAGAPSGAYVRYRPAQGDVTLAWQLPDALPLAVTEGLRPGPSAQLGIVYRTPDGVLAAAVAGPNGWARRPEVLARAPRALLLGLDWWGASLEIVWAPAPSVDRPDGWNEPVITTWHADGTTSQRTLDRSLICDPRWLRCGAQAAYRQRGATVWRLLVSMAEPATLWTVVETGIRHRVEGFDFPWDARDDTDLTASGLLLEAALRLRGIFTAAGEFRPLSGEVVAQFAGWSHDYLADDGALGWRPQFALADATVFAEQAGGSVVGVEVPVEQPERLLAYRLEGTAVASRAVLGRVTPDCPHLAAGSLVPRASGGHWLVSASGCVMGVAANSERADPLGLFGHLARGGSLCTDCRRVGPLVALGWVLLGLPLSLGVTVVVVGWRRRGSYRTLGVPLHRLLIVPVLMYDVSAALLLIDLLPMLG